jgi:hypothetical protein
VKVLKLADLYDNLGDCRSFPVETRRKTVGKSHFYLDAVRHGLPPDAGRAVRLVEQRLAEVESGLTT